MNQIRSILDGRKTYIIAIVTIIVGVLDGEWGATFQLIDLPWVTVGPDPIQWMLVGMGLATTRSGIAKNGLGK